MDENDKGWAQELRRRIAAYDEIETRGDWRGKMGAVDYWGLLALTSALVAGFWVWGG